MILSIWFGGTMNGCLKSLALLFVAALSGCSGSIYHQKPILGFAPVAIALDARQRVILSQPEDSRDKTKNDPAFRRFCAEPSPDVFTVMGVSGSGGGSFGLGADKSVNVALQAAFSSSETGSTIARTQTINMLREMMFRTCERYLSGAISTQEFPIIAARDQRIMVSILAIEQLTGAITPRALAISAGGTAATGMDATELVEALATAHDGVATADGDVAAAAKKQTAADAPGGVCVKLRKTKAAGSPDLTADETNALKACDDADAAYAAAKDKHDAAQSHYDALVAASKSASGLSTATASGAVTFADETARAQAVGAVAGVVDDIVAATFAQDETQLFCIRTLEDRSGPYSPDVRDGCQSYLLAKVRADESALAARYDLSVAQVREAQSAGVSEKDRRNRASLRLNGCVAQPGKEQAITDALAAAKLASFASPLVAASKRSQQSAYLYLFQAGTIAETKILAALDPVCGLQGG